MYIYHVRDQFNLKFPKLIKLSIYLDRNETYNLSSIMLHYMLYNTKTKTHKNQDILLINKLHSMNHMGVIYVSSLLYVLILRPILVTDISCIFILNFVIQYIII